MNYRMSVVLFLACFAAYMWITASSSFSPFVNTISALIAGAGAGLFIASLMVVRNRRHQETVLGGASLTGPLNGADIIEDKSWK